MYWFEYAGMVLGLVWLFCILARMPALVLDTRLFWRSLRALQYQGSWLWIAVARFVIPGVLCAPAMIWMDGMQAFRVTSAQAVYQTALELCSIYGPEQPFPAPEEEELEEVEQGVLPPSTIPYFRALSSDDEVR